ncbi:MAG TPA: class I SAM-dependent methyltransferase [Longimicrobiales bacterium]|nr:class I SAM-dependent methyltransferase [Longimicrobiales bacterium]
MAEDRHDLFDAGWLSLREPADHRSRHEPFATRLDEEGRARGWREVVDLGGGTGSNVRWLSPRLSWARQWTVVDHDPALLARVRPPAAGALRTLRGDLSREGLAAAQHAHLVTASALLDLASREWVQALAEVCAAAGCGLLFALSYDGEIRLTGEADPDDGLVTEAVNRHQLGEKGMGTALGPGATAAAVAALTAGGYRCLTAPSPWVLAGAGDAALARALMEGWVEAAEEIHPRASGRLRGWLDRRVAAFRAGALGIRVGHTDLLALPPDAAT